MSFTTRICDAAYATVFACCVWAAFPITGIAAAQEGAPGPVRIGAVLPLTGSEARQGEVARRAIAEAAAETLAYPVTIFYEDSASEPARAVAAFQKLVAANQIEAVLTIGSPSAMALAPLANKSEVMLMAIVATPAFSTPDDFTYRLNGSSETELKFLVDILTSTGAGKRIGVIYADNEYGQGARAALENAAAGALEIVSDQSFSPQTADFSPQLTKLKSDAPDAVVVAAWGAAAGTMMRKAKGLGLRLPVYCLQACENKGLIAAAQGAAEGLFVSAPDSAADTDFTTRYRARFNEQPSFVALRMSDAVRILAHAAQGCAEYRRSRCLREQLSPGHELPGQSFPIRFDEYGDLEERFVLKKVVKGELVPVPAQ